MYPHTHLQRPSHTDAPPHTHTPTTPFPHRRTHNPPTHTRKTPPPPTHTPTRTHMHLHTPTTPPSTHTHGKANDKFYPGIFSESWDFTMHLSCFLCDYQWHDKYQDVVCREEQAPHIFWVAGQAYRRLRENHTDQVRSTWNNNMCIYWVVDWGRTTPTR